MLIAAPQEGVWTWIAAGPHSEQNGINAEYTVTLAAPLEYRVDRAWTAPAGTNHNNNQGMGLTVRMPPAPPSTATDCTTIDQCAMFEVVHGAVPFVPDDVFTFTSSFDYEGEYQGALAAPEAAGRGACQWLSGPAIPALQ